VSEEQDDTICHHESALTFAVENLIAGMYLLDNTEEHKGKSAEEKLGVIINLVCAVIYDASEALGIERWHMATEDGQLIEVTPTQESIPPKGLVN
jgi:hypothetical protein